MLKAKISFQITLNELFARIMNLHQDFSNHDINQIEKEQMAGANNFITKSPTLDAVEEKV